MSAAMEADGALLAAALLAALGAALADGDGVAAELQAAKRSGMAAAAASDRGMRFVDK